MPSFVADFVDVVAWISDDGETFVKDLTSINNGSITVFYGNRLAFFILLTGFVTLLPLLSFLYVPDSSVKFQRRNRKSLSSSRLVVIFDNVTNYFQVSSVRQLFKQDP